MENAKYEFVPGDEIVIAPGRTLKRIRALVAITTAGVAPGELGGYIETEANLQVSGNAWVFGNVRVSGDARVYGNAWVFGNARVSGDAWVSGDAQVFGDARVYGDAQVSGDASKTPLQIGGLTWHVTIIDAHMHIGCQYHSLADWAAFDDAKIAAMDGRDALRFWRAYKPLILGVAREDGRLASDPEGVK